MPKTSFFSINAAKSQFSDFFFENRAPSLFVVDGPLTSCKKSEKSYVPIPRKIPNGQRRERGEDNCSSIGHFPSKIAKLL